eukprot:2638942-Prymnesium_polylepis.1
MHTQKACSVSTCAVWKPPLWRFVLERGLDRMCYRCTHSPGPGTEWSNGYRDLGGLLVRAVTGGSWYMWVPDLGLACRARP